MMKLTLILTFLIPILCFAKPSKEEITAYITKRSVEIGIHPSVALALASTENIKMDPVSTNWKEPNGIPSRGIFQIQDRTAKEECAIKIPELLYNYKINTDCALKYLKKQLDRYKGDYLKALAAYNAGGYYKCRLRHLTRKKNPLKCLVGLPVNFDYLLKILVNIKS